MTTKEMLAKHSQNEELTKVLEAVYQTEIRFISRRSAQMIADAYLELVDGVKAKMISNDT